MLIKWIKKKLGYHVCEKFSSWKKVVCNWTREPRIGDAKYASGEKIEFTKICQERHCLKCDKIEQIELFF